MYGNQEISGKCLNHIAQCPVPPAKMKTLLILAKSPSKTEIKLFRGVQFHMKTRAGLKYPVND